MFDRYRQAIRQAAATPAPGVDPTKFNDPVAAKTEWGPLGSWRAATSRDTVKRLRERGADRLVFGGLLSAHVARMFSPFALIGVMALVMRIPPAFLAVFLVPLLPWTAFVMASARPSNFDRGRALFWIGWLAPRTADVAKGSCRFSDVRALQILQSTRHGGGGEDGPSYEYACYQLNLVLQDGRRLGVVTTTALEPLRQDAARLQTWLGCKLWDTSRTIPAASGAPSSAPQSAASRAAGLVVSLGFLAYMGYWAYSAIGPTARAEAVERLSSVFGGIEWIDRRVAPLPHELPVPPGLQPGWNLIEDPSFESRDPGLWPVAWFADARGYDMSARWMVAPAASGTHALSIKTAGSARGMGWPGWRSTARFRVAKGQALLFKVAARSPDLASADLQADLFTADGRYLGGNSLGCRAVGADWQDLQLLITPSRTFADASRVQLALLQCLPQGQQLFFDDVYFGAPPVAPAAVVPPKP